MLTKIEVPTGVVNGINLIFLTSISYVSTTLTVLINGLPIIKEDADGFFETDPLNRVFTFKEPPRIGDKITVIYSYIDPLMPITRQTIYLNGHISKKNDIYAKLESSVNLIGTITKVDLIGKLEKVPNE